MEHFTLPRRVPPGDTFISRKIREEREAVQQGRTYVWSLVQWKYAHDVYIAQDGDQRSTLSYKTGQEII